MASKLIELADAHRARGRLREAERVIDQAVVKAAGQSEKALALLAKARILCAAGKPESAAAPSTDAIEIYRSASDNDGLAEAQLAYSEVLLAQKDLETAKEMVLQSVSIYRKAGKKGKMAEAKTKLATVILGGGFRADCREAAIVAQDAIEVSQEAGDKLAEASALAVLAKAKVASGEYGEASGSASDAMTLFKELGAKKEQAKVMVELAEARIFMSNSEDGGGSSFDVQVINDAMELLKDAQSIYQELGDKAGQATVLQVMAIGHLSLAQAKSSHNEAKESEKVARKSQELFWALNDKSGVARNWLTIAQVRYVTSDMEDSVQTTMVAQKLYKDTGNTLGAAEAARFLEMVKAAEKAAGDDEQVGGSSTSQSVDYLMVTEKKVVHAFFDAFSSRQARRLQ
mmetsp:Transcript_6005/g.13253  ORF Transcript_6005/g.13253 Transcript_6005/m.13253 type:complete len:401 (+) Transcript_6005:117-1319(+)|eukprot:CAMPEP_0178422840 /NCGR_PEP_ID=MMETSP0689_2-20121128/27383_1 /TAXON_ID=160604 /ORGANISM="Amphidinium massartii, Strain CS-259" /LENGTH=400 /DNA_ID=CAMNT_0020044421 /DNA_START=86 /DNA_END=1288 /DNA_ORIENTATION=+